MYQGVGMAEVVQELVAQALALVRPRDETSNVKELDGHAALAVDTGAVVGFATVRDIVSLAGTVDL
jgi:acid phosphatase family membrane protein YuiD